MPKTDIDSHGLVSRKNTISSKIKVLFGNKSTTTNSGDAVTKPTKIQNIYNNESVKNSNINSNDELNIRLCINSNSPTNSHSSGFSLSNKIDRSSKNSSRSSIDHANSSNSTSPRSLSPVRSPISSTIKHNNNNNNIDNTSDTSIAQTPTTPLNSNSNCKRFIVLENGNHVHHLKAAKRQEKLSSMLKNMVGSQKVRDDAVSAVPDIISNTSVPGTPTGSIKPMDPPTLMSSLVKRLETRDPTPRVMNNKANVDLDKSSIKSENNELSVAISNPSSNISKSKCERFADKYGRCMEVAGRGAFGTVRICHKKSTKKQEGETLFAVKEFIKANNESSQRYEKRLTAEFCISSSLHHTNIVGTIDLLKDAKGDYLQVMEYCPGGDLFSLIIAGGKLEYLESDCFFKQLLKGVVYMHDMGVCHRDLKPENLLLTSDGTLKITDFGNSECFKMAWERDIHLSGGICGSSPYIAPEEYVQDGFDPRAVDIWSCGVIYMAMRTGRQLWSIAKKDDPFYAKYLKGRKEKGGYKPIELLKRARCRNVIYSMLDPIPQRRITGRQILNSEWGRQIKGCHESHAIKS